MVSSGFVKKVFEYIPEEEFKYIEESIDETIKSVYAFRNSVMGVLDAVSKDYSNLEFDAKNIKEIIDDEAQTGFLHEVIDKLG